MEDKDKVYSLELTYEEFDFLNRAFRLSVAKSEVLEAYKDENFKKTYSEEIIAKTEYYIKMTDILLNKFNTYDQKEN